MEMISYKKSEEIFFDFRSTGLDIIRQTVYSILYVIIRLKGGPFLMVRKGVSCRLTLSKILTQGTDCALVEYNGKGYISGHQ